MSRASDVRDDVQASIAAELPTATVEAFIVPNFTREELVAGPRIIVRNGGRELAIDQGVDARDVIVEVGVVGVVPSRADVDEEYRVEELAAADVFDDLMESVIDLFIRDGALNQIGMAEHRLTTLETAVQLDAQKYYTEGIWLSVIRLTYRDSED